MCAKPSTSGRRFTLPVVVSGKRGYLGATDRRIRRPGIRMFPAGSLLIMDHRINQHVINRCRPSDADILVYGDTISLIRAHSTHIDYNEMSSNRVTANEVDILLREGKHPLSWREDAYSARVFRRSRPLVVA